MASATSAAKTSFRGRMATSRIRWEWRGALYGGSAVPDNQGEWSE